MPRPARSSRCCYDYVRVTHVLEIAFPADSVCCDYCEFCHSENAGTRFRCYLTGEILPFHNGCLGSRCPLDLPGPALSDLPEE